MRGGGWLCYMCSKLDLCVAALHCYTWITGDGATSGDGAASAAAYPATYHQEILYPLSPIEISHISTLWSITWNGPSLVPSASPASTANPPATQPISSPQANQKLCPGFEPAVRPLSHNPSQQLTLGGSRDGGVKVAHSLTSSKTIRPETFCCPQTQS